MSTLSVGTIKSNTSGSPPTIQDSGGTEVGTFCRAWVNFNGTGTVAIRASFNVTSITDNGTGDYTINFTNAMSDANYSATISAQSYTNVATSTSPSASLIRVECRNTAATLVDPANVYASVFR